jgi:single-strand DNA-binding protein
MSDINQLTVTGRLTKDSELKQLSTGTDLLTFDVAVNTGFGQYAKTLFITVNLWGKTGPKLQQYLLKGKPVGLSGELQQQEWTSKVDGSKQRKIVLSTNSVVLMSGGAAPQTEPSYDIVEDDDQPGEVQF